MAKMVDIASAQSRHIMTYFKTPALPGNKDSSSWWHDRGCKPTHRIANQGSCCVTCFLRVWPATWKLMPLQCSGLLAAWIHDDSEDPEICWQRPLRKVQTKAKCLRAATYHNNGIGRLHLNFSIFSSMNFLARYPFYQFLSECAYQHIKAQVKCRELIQSSARCPWWIFVGRLTNQASASKSGPLAKCAGDGPLEKSALQSIASCGWIMWK